MRKTFHTAALGVALAALLAVGSVAEAQGPGGPGRGGPRELRGQGVPGVQLGGLDLTDAQREQIRALVQQYRESGQPVQEQLRQAQQAQRDALQTVPVNEGLVRSTTEALAQAQAEAALVQARLRADVLALLTPDQIQAMEDRQANREQRAEQARERIRERREQRQQDQQDPQQ